MSKTGAKYPSCCRRARRARDARILSPNPRATRQRRGRAAARHPRSGGSPWSV